MSRHRLTDDGKVVSLMHRPPSTPQQRFCNPIWPLTGMALFFYVLYALIVCVALYAVICLSAV
jgi:hypothetical protein